MSTLHLTATTTVAEFRKEFNEAFGAQVRIYNGRSQAAMEDALSSIGLTANGEFECRSSLTVASFIERMQNEFGLKVKVYTCDEWVAVLDGLTLESAGKVKKNAVKADMESMIAYQRTESAAETAATPEVDNTAAIEVAKAAAEKAKAEAEAAKARAEADAAQAAAVKAQAEAAAMAAAKAAADKVKAELERQKAEAEAAKAELARIQAEAAKAKAEAEAAKAAAEKAQADAVMAAETPAPAAPAKTSSNKGALNGLFSVGENKKVRFSMGNLQFNAKKYEFRFAEHQYDSIGAGNEKIAPNYDGWIDLFGYGTSGYMGCEPFETDKTSKPYPLMDIAGTNYDWGVYNPISNGGNKEGLWRTMTKDEWSYLIKTRPNAEKLCAKACVNNVNGYIFLPDDFYEHRVRIPFDSTPDEFRGNTYDLTQWGVLEAAGVVFLPCNGIRQGSTVSGSYAAYWTSNAAPNWAYYTDLTSWSYRQHHYGSGVRLVQDVK